MKKGEVALKGKRILGVPGGVALFFIMACSNAGDPPPGGEASNPNYYPNGDGSTWVYRYQRFSNNVPYGDPVELHQVFDGTGVIRGAVCQRLVTVLLPGPSLAVEYIRDDDDDEVTSWGREFGSAGKEPTSVIFDPPWAALTYPLRVNRSWLEVKNKNLSPAALGLDADVDLDGRDDLVDVEIVISCVAKEDLTVPNGVYPDCFKLRRTVYATFHMTSGGDVDCTYVQYGWFKPTVGYVQFTGDEITVPNGARYTFLSQLGAYHFPGEGF